MTTYTWRGNSANWTALAAWSPIGLPGSADIIAAALQPNSHLAITDSESIASLTLPTTTLDLSGTLTTTGTITAPVNFLPGGILQGGTLVADAMANGTLDGVVWSGTTADSMTIRNGTTITGAAGPLHVTGPATSFGTLTLGAGDMTIDTGATFDASLSIHNPAGSDTWPKLLRHLPARHPRQHRLSHRHQPASPGLRLRAHHRDHLAHRAQPRHHRSHRLRPR